MFDTIFYRRFRTLDKSEIAAFKRLLTLTYRKTSLQQRLLDYIRVQHNSKKLNKLTKEAAFKKLFPDQPFKDKKISNLLSNLNTHLEYFFIHQELEHNPVAKSMLLLDHLKKRKKSFLIEEQLRRTQQELAKQPNNSIWHTLQQLTLAHQYYFSVQQMKVEGGGFKQLQLANELLDQFFCGLKMQYAVEFQQAEKILNHSMSQHLVEPTVAHIQQNLLGNPVHKLYLILWQFSKQSTQEQFFILKKQLFNQRETFNDTDQLKTLLYLVNYGSQAIQNGQTKFYREVLLLYLFAIRQNLLVQDGFIPFDSFHNMVNCAVQLKRFALADAIIEHGESFLIPKIKSQAVLVAKANLLYHQRLYSNALQLLNTIPVRTDLYHNLLLRMLQIICQVEVDIARAIELCDHLRSYIKKQSDLTEYKKLAWFNFIRLTKKILNPNDYSLSLDDLKTTTPVINRPWLQTKILQRQKRHPKA